MVSNSTIYACSTQENHPHFVIMDVQSWFKAVPYQASISLEDGQRAVIKVDRSRSHQVFFFFYAIKETWWSPSFQIAMPLLSWRGLHNTISPYQCKREPLDCLKPSNEWLQPLYDNKIKPAGNCWQPVFPDLRLAVSSSNWAAAKKKKIPMHLHVMFESQEEPVHRWWSEPGSHRDLIRTPGNGRRGPDPRKLWHFSSGHSFADLSGRPYPALFFAKIHPDW